MRKLARFMDTLKDMKWNLKFDSLNNEIDQILSGIPCGNKKF